MNLSQLRTLTSYFVEDPNQTRFSSAQYLNAINRANEQFAMDTGCTFKDQTITIVSGTAGYSLNSDFMWEKKVTHKQILLDPISRQTLEFYSRGVDWTSRNGTPKYFMIDPEEARKRITLFPNPTADDVGANLVLTYFALPNSLASDSDTPLNSSALLAQFHIAIAAFSSWMLLNFLKADPLNEPKKAEMLKLYQDKVSKATDTFGNTQSEPLRFRTGRIWYR